MPSMPAPSRAHFGFGGRSKNQPTAARAPLFPAPGPESADDHGDYGDDPNCPYPQTPRRSPYLQKYGVQLGRFQTQDAPTSPYTHAQYHSRHRDDIASFGQKRGQVRGDFASGDLAAYPSDDHNIHYPEERSRIASELSSQPQQRTVLPPTFASQRSQISKSRSQPSEAPTPVTQSDKQQPPRQRSWQAPPSTFMNRVFNQADEALNNVKPPPAVHGVEYIHNEPGFYTVQPLSGSTQPHASAGRAQHEGTIDDPPSDSQEPLSEQTQADPEIYVGRKGDVPVLNASLRQTTWFEDGYPQGERRYDAKTKWLMENPKGHQDDRSASIGRKEWLTGDDQCHSAIQYPQAAALPHINPPNIGSLSQISFKQHQDPSQTLTVEAGSIRKPSVIRRDKHFSPDVNKATTGDTVKAIDHRPGQDADSFLSDRPPTFSGTLAWQKLMGLAEQFATTYDAQCQEMRASAVADSTKLDKLQSELSGAKARLSDTEEKLRQSLEKSTEHVRGVHKLFVDALVDFDREGMLDESLQTISLARDNLNTLSIRQLTDVFTDACRTVVSLHAQQRGQVQSQADMSQSLADALQSAGFARADQIDQLSVLIQEGHQEHASHLTEVKDLFGQKENYDAKIHKLGEELAQKIAHLAETEELVKAKEGAIQRHIQQLVELLAAIGVPDSLIAERPQEALQFLRERWETELKLHETNLSSLQAAKARCEKELEICRDELSSARQESLLASSHYDRIQTSLSQLQEAVQTSNVQCLAVSSEKDKREISETALRNAAEEVEQLRKVAQEARTGYKNAQAHVIDLQSQLDSATEHEKHVAKQIEDYKIQISTFTNNQSNLEQQLDRAKQENTQLQGGNALTSSQRGNVAKIKAQNVELMQSMIDKDKLLKQALNEKESLEQRLGQLHQQSIQAEIDSGAKIIERYESKQLRECERAFVKYLTEELRETAEAKAEQAGHAKYRSMESDYKKIQREAAKERKEIGQLKRQLAELKHTSEQARQVRKGSAALSDTDKEEEGVTGPDTDVDTSSDDLPLKTTVRARHERASVSQPASHRSSMKREPPSALATTDKSSTSQSQSKKVRFDPESAPKTGGVAAPKATDTDIESSMILDVDVDPDAAESEVPLPPPTQKAMRMPRSTQRPRGRKRT